MPTDLELIKQLEKELGKTLTRKKDIKFSEYCTKEYQTDSNGKVVVLMLNDLGINYIPQIVFKFKKLKALSLRDNKIRKLSSKIFNLQNLEKLNLTFNKLSTLPSEVSLLRKLSEFLLNFNDFNTFPSEILKLKNLNYLGFYGSKLSSIPSKIEQLKELAELNLGGNNFTSFPVEILKCVNLERLLLHRNNLSTIPSDIILLPRLKRLTLGINKFNKFPLEILQLVSLEDLEINENLLTSLPPEIDKLKNLTQLSLENNRLTFLPYEIIKLRKLKHLGLNDNPIEQPPPEIAFDEDNINRIRDYFESLESQGEDFIYEAKLILVGEPGAGKTSLSIKLNNPDYKLNPKEPMTEGIDVNKWEFLYSEKIPFRCNIWDFGGQEIMHATHRYFLTKRTLYIVVADNRKENTDFYYWLNILELFSGKCPVLIVLNEKHNHKKSVPENILKTFTSVKKVFEVNLDDNTGLEYLSKEIKKYLCNLDHVGNDPIPKKWVSIRKALEKEKSNYISYDQYLHICKAHGIEDEQKARYISEFLHDLGVVLHFQDDLTLNKTVILNTGWATEAVYKILFDHDIIESGGTFNNKNIERVWHQDIYKSKHSELLQLMLNFELCFEIDETRQYIIPELLPDKSSADQKYWTEISSKGKELLRFEYRYDFMPKGIISRLIVRMNKYIHKRQNWKSGVILKNGDSLAEITETIDKRVLKIRITGNDRLETLSIIRGYINKLNDTFENLSVDEMVPCNCAECNKNEVPIFFKYKLLKQYKQEEEKFIKCNAGNLKNVDVLSLISDVILKEDSEMKDEKGSKDQIINFNPTINTTSNADATADVDIEITNEIQININGLSGAFDNLKDDLLDEAEDDDTKKSVEKEIAKVKKAFEQLQQSKTKDDVHTGAMGRINRFIKKIHDTNTTIGKVFGKIEDNVCLAQDLAGYYNKIALLSGLPPVDIF